MSSPPPHQPLRESLRQSYGNLRASRGVPIVVFLVGLPFGCVGASEREVAPHVGQLIGAAAALGGIVGFVGGAMRLRMPVAIGAPFFGIGAAIGMGLGCHLGLDDLLELAGSTILVAALAFVFGSMADDEPPASPPPAS